MRFSASSTPPQLKSADRTLGRGRAAIVFESMDAQGRTTARKVFNSSPLTSLIQYIFLGSSNPYAWSEHAIQSAILRRRILAPLVKHWFGNRLEVAEGWNVDWNSEFNAWQLHTRAVEGRPPRLHHPLCKRGSGEVHDLIHEVLKPLQGHLIEAGFDGQVWQAGLGNPVALTNFLRIDKGDSATWAWIDLESGVPALFPAHIPSLWSFYLPCAWRHKRPLFDDVDIPKLRDWLRRERSSLILSLQESTLEGIERDVAALEYHQAGWRRLTRLERSLGAQKAKGRISAEQCLYYSQRHLRWLLHESLRAGHGLARRTSHGLAHCARKLAGIRWGALCKNSGTFALSSRYRAQRARSFVTARIQRWQDRGQLSACQASQLTAHQADHESSVYLADFAFHLGIKPFVKSFEYIVAPALLAAGTIDQVTLGLIWVCGGSVGRTMYTGGRLIQNLLTGRELPLISLWVGLIPVIGNLAFPLQIVRSSRVQDDPLAQFILYDGFAAIGRRIPIWGGRDTLTEHRLNRIPDWVIPARGPIS